jgi:AcrR family transcriptional regulator
MLAAVDLVEQDGYDNLNMSSLAKKLEVKPPSLYNHVHGIADIRRQLVTIVLVRMEDAVRAAAIGRARESALREIAYAYRRFATKQSELYRVFTSAPTISGSENLAALANTLRQVLSPFALSKLDETNFIRVFHAALHGFVALEHAGFFQNSAAVTANESFDALVESQILILNSYQRSLK